MAERFDRIWHNARLATLRGDLPELGVIERRDDIQLAERSRFLHGGLPQFHASVQARTRTASRELRMARIERGVLIDQLAAEWIADGVIVVEAAVQTLDV